MTRKHFNAIAEAIRTLQNDEITEEGKKYVAEALALVCKSTNSRFDTARFIEACGVETS